MDRSDRQLGLPDSESFDATHIEDEGNSTQQDAEVRQEQGSGFIDILNFAFQWGIPSVDITRMGVPESSSILNSKTPYTLGSGHTATVIRHETGDEEAAIVPPKTTIAIKIFSHYTDHDTSNGLPPAERSTRAQTYGAILRELGVFCHPKLSEHPNIVKLLFLGWQSNSPFPVLGLELGDYGSLDFILRAPGLGLSRLQRANVTMDIAVGLHALHENEFIHGDLKPGNIIIVPNAHSERKVLAKLTDFGGASRADGYDSPAFITHLWCAPEVLHDDADLDWEKCDVYSYGLIVASIWGRPESFETERQASSCILASFVPGALEGEDRENFLLIMKSVETRNPLSVVSHILGSFSEVAEAMAGGVVRSTLTPRFWERPSIYDIISEEYMDFAIDLGRDLRAEIAFTPNQQRFTKARARLFKVWSESFRERPREYQEFVLRQLKDEVDNNSEYFSDSFEDIPEHIDSNMDSAEYLDLVRQGMRKAVDSATGSSLLHFGDATSAGRLCYHISLCYIYPIGADFSLGTGLKWLKSAALGGYELASYSAPIMHHHCAEGNAIFPHERLFLTAGALCRSLVCLDMLATKWPGHYQAVVKLIQQRGMGLFDLEREFNDTYHMVALSCYHRQTPVDIKTLDLVDCIMSCNLERAQELLEEDIDARINNKACISALHALSYIRDRDAARLARKLVKKGADLNAMCAMASGLSVSRSDNCAIGTPLLSAIRCGQTWLASKLLECHSEFDITIKDYVKALAAALSYWQHDLAERLFDLLENKPELCDTTRPTELSETYEDAMLQPRYLMLVAMDSRDYTTLERRLYHGPRYDEAYKKTIQLLLRKGADPTLGDWMDCPLYRCLTSDDHIALQCFVNYLKTDTTQDALSRVIDPGRCRGRPWSANEHTGLQTCIYSKSRRCFYILLDEFPLLVEERNLRGLTALHSATFYPDDTLLLKALLDRGAEILATSKDNSSPLMRALRNNNIAAADLMLSYCTSDQLEVLFRRQRDTGRSLFSRMIDRWLRDRDPQLLDSFRWVIEHGGAHFYGRTSIVGPHTVEIPFWNDILARVRAPSKRWQLNDLALVDLLFSAFPDKINILQQDGRSPLHIATWYGHVEVVRVLLRKYGADVNLEYGVCEYHPQDPRGMFGRTALNQIISRSKASGIPEEVRRGGFEEVARWKEDCAAILSLLREAGGRSGSGATFAQTMEALAVDETLRITVTSMNEPELFEYDDLWTGDWPQSLPQDHTSVPLPDLELMNRGMDTVRSLVGSFRAEYMVREREAQEARRGPGYRESLKATAGAMRRIWRLPRGWEVRRLGDGKYYFVDHNSRSTTWIKPPLSREALEASDEDSVTPATGESLTDQGQRGGPLEEAA